jgi:hypothetical protein
VTRLGEGSNDRYLDDEHLITRTRDGTGVLRAVTSTVAATMSIEQVPLDMAEP